jgi:hypothetical protein
MEKPELFIIESTSLPKNGKHRRISSFQKPRTHSGRRERTGLELPEPLIPVPGKQIIETVSDRSRKDPRCTEHVPCAPKIFGCFQCSVGSDIYLFREGVGPVDENERIDLLKRGMMVKKGLPENTLKGGEFHRSALIVPDDQLNSGMTETAETVVQKNIRRCGSVSIVRSVQFVPHSRSAIACASVMGVPWFRFVRMTTMNFRSGNTRIWLRNPRVLPA